MSEAVVTLKKGKGRTVKSGGLWIYDNEIESVMGDFTDGDVVTVHGKRIYEYQFKNSYPYDDTEERPENKSGFYKNACEKRLGVPEENRRHQFLPGDFRRSGLAAGAGGG